MKQDIDVYHTRETKQHKKNVLYFQAKKLKIKNPDLALLHIDGDPAETAEEFSIEILPAAYKLIQPLKK